MNHDAVAAIKRQVNSILRYLILLGVYNLVWRKNGLTDQMILLRHFLKKIKRHKSIQSLVITFHSGRIFTLY